MSSSNLVQIVSLKEVTFGVTPAAGNFSTIRYTTENLSGTPVTVESAESRNDRASGGQLLTGINVEGGIEGELSGSDTSYKPYFLAGMMYPAWVPGTTSTSTFTIDDVAKTITDTAAGTDLTTIFSVGDALVLKSPFLLNINKVVYVSAVTATVVTYIGDLVDETAVVGAIVGRPEYVEVGGGTQTTTHSFSIEKKFLDLTRTDKAIDYLGTVVAGFTMGFTYGELATVGFTFNSKTWEVPAIPISDPPRVIDPPDTDIPLNSSGDFGKLIIDNIDQSLCFQSLTIELSNNLQPNTCLGEITPQFFVPGSAAINVTASLYLGDTSFQYVQKKIQNTPISIFGSVTNADGGVAFYLPEVLLNFPDPGATGGKDTQVTLELAGTTKAPATGNQFRLYWI